MGDPIHDAAKAYIGALDAAKKAATKRGRRTVSLDEWVRLEAVSAAALAALRRAVKDGR